MESWVQTNLWFKKFNAECFRRLLLEFVRPATVELEDRNLVRTFHFLFEPDPHFFLRVELNASDQSETVKSIIRKHLSAIRDLLIPREDDAEFTDYPGEAGDYGENGWDITKKMFEMGSRMAIAKIDPAFKTGPKFFEGKILHCVLNSIGHGKFGELRHSKFVTNEALFHLDEFIGRILIIRDKRNLDESIESEIRQLVDEKIEYWKGRILEVV